MSAANTKENRERLAALDLLALVRSIFAHLPGWTVEDPDPDRDDEPNLRNVRVSHTSGARLYVHRSDWPPEINIGAYWPRRGDPQTGEEYAPRERVRISFSPFRAPEVLAKDINRRFVSVYLPEWEKQRATCDEATRQADTAHQLAVVLGDILGSAPRDYSEGWRIYAHGPAYEIRVTRFGTVYFERVSLDKPDRIIELSRLFATWGRADRQPEAEPVCKACFRPESECSAEPCPEVMADREATA